MIELQRRIFALVEEDSAAFTAGVYSDLLGADSRRHLRAAIKAIGPHCIHDVGHGGVVERLEFRRRLAKQAFQLAFLKVHPAAHGTAAKDDAVGFHLPHGFAVAFWTVHGV